MHSRNVSVLQWLHRITSASLIGVHGYNQYTDCKCFLVASMSSSLYSPTSFQGDSSAHINMNNTIQSPPQLLGNECALIIPDQGNKWYDINVMSSEYQRVTYLPSFGIFENPPSSSRWSQLVRRESNARTKTQRQISTALPCFTIPYYKITCCD